MKKAIHIVFNVLPFFIWMGWLFCALKDFAINLFTMQIFLLLGLPLLYSILNTIFSSNEDNFAIYNSIFGVSQVVGYYIAGALYYDHISGDSETVFVTNTFSGISIVYILIITLIFYGIRAVAEKTNTFDQVEYKEWDEPGFSIPPKFRLDENSKLHEAIDVFYLAGGFDFFRVINPEEYASNWLDFVGNLYSEIEEGKYKTDGVYHKNPLTEEQKNTLIAQGVPEIFTNDIV